MTIETAVEHVHVIFKTHFDFGFTDFAQAVQDQYFASFIPQVLEQAQQLREEDAPHRYVWTTGSWLIYKYLEEADAGDRRRMEAAIEAGDIVWHALPFTLHSELADVSLFEFGLTLSGELDERFGKKTIAAKMTDVPGHTRGIISPLAEAGVEFLHIGVNEAATPPDVPPLFVWKDTRGAQIIVMYQHAYGAEMQHASLRDALAFGFTEDNVGPQSLEDISALYQSLESVFPGADVKASTLDHFARAVRKIKATLPVVRDEIGDTWIHGAGTDPRKVSRYRALSRLRRQWLKSAVKGPGMEVLNRFSRHLLCVAEHTWGLDEKLHLDDYKQYAQADFAEARTQAPFKKMEASWLEQRDYVDKAIEELAKTPYGAEAATTLNKLVPARIEEEAADIKISADALNETVYETVYETQHFEIQFDRTGALVQLTDRMSGRQWASHDASLCRLGYQTYAEADYNRFMDEYLSSRPEWGILDNSKPGIGDAGAVSRVWEPELKQIRRRAQLDADTFIVDLESPEDAVEKFGCPARFTITYRFLLNKPTLEIEVQWFEKAACRLPEAVWCSFVLLDTEPPGWMMDKMGQRVSPLHVVSKGNRSLHAIDQGLFYRDEASTLVIASPDVPLVAPGEPALLRFEDRQPVLSGGWHFNLYNNLWGTNFPMWYEDDGCFRFVLRFNNETV